MLHDNALSFKEKVKRIIKITPFLTQKISESLNIKERIIILSVLFIFFISLAWALMNTYLKKTTLIAADGGTYIEGIVGKPEYLNPVLAKGSEADLSLSELIYSSIMKYDENDQLVNDIAANWKISEDKTQYAINLREDIYFHDGERLTADDVLFTLNIIQNRRYNSPLRANWMGVEAEKNNDFQITFKIKQPFTPFLHNLTFGILPKHIWQDISPEEFQISKYNKTPIGSGPFILSRLEKNSDNDNIRQAILKKNKEYYLKPPYVDTLLLKFYDSEESAINALNEREVMGLNDISHTALGQLQNDHILLHEITLPRYYAVFLNIYQSETLANDNVRQFLAWSACQEEIINEVLDSKGKKVDSPILTLPVDEIEGFEKRGCSIEKAQEILKKDAEWKLKDYKEKEEGETNVKTENEKKSDTQENQPQKQIFYDKSDNPLMVTLTVPDFPSLVETAEILKNQWEKAGALINIEVMSVGDLEINKIEPREYEALLFGQTLNIDPDPRPYWHSGERKSPGQNIVSYNNSEVDSLLDKGREETNEDTRQEIYQKFQLQINKDIPAIFIYSPYYLYPVSKEVKGINLKEIANVSQRYSNINNWYLKQKRVRQ